MLFFKGGGHLVSESSSKVIHFSFIIHNKIHTSSISINDLIKIIVSYIGT